MALDIDFVITLLITGLMLIIGIIFVIQSVVKKRKAYSLTIAIFIGMVASLVETLRLGLDLSLKTSAVLTISLSTWSLMYFITMFFFMQLNSESINPVVFGFGLTFFLGEIVFGWLNTLPYYTDNFEHVITLLWDFCYDALGILVFAYGAYVHFRIYKKTNEKVGLLLFSALGLIAFGFFWAFMGDLVKELGGVGIVIQGFFSVNGIFANSLLVGDIFKLVGLFIFVGFYMFNFEYIFRLPFEIDSILLFNRLGMLIYAGKYRITDYLIEDENIEKESIPIDLITAAINAFSTFMAETTGSKKPLEKIITGDKLVIIKQSKNASVAIISTQSSYFLKRSMKDLLQAVEEKYKDELKLDFTESKYYDDVPRLIGHKFPYLRLPIIEKY